MSDKIVKVFVTQEVSTVDYSQAAEWGELIFVTASNDKISPMYNSLNNRIILDKIDRVLENFQDDDMLVCTGAPSVMAIIGSKLGGKLRRMLIWDGKSSSYFEISI